MVTVTDAYAGRSAEYIDLLASMDAVHPSDRQLVDTWTDAVAGTVLDAGCGPGHWTHYLNTRGLDVRGIDRVEPFIEHARASYPGVRFDYGSIDDISAPTGSVSVVLSWYSTIHHHPSDLATPVAEFARVLAVGGTLILGYFDGELVEPFDHAVTTAYRWSASELQKLLEHNGFEVIEVHRRAAIGARAHGAMVCRRI